MRFVTINVKSTPLMRRWRVVHDVLRASTLAGIILWQEITPRYYKKAVRRLDSTHWRHAHLDTEVPISWRHDQYVLIAEGKELAHHGFAHVTPNRWVTWVLLRERSSGRLFLVMNAHYVSGAWNKKRKLMKAWRRQKWLLHWRKQRALIARLLKQYDVPIIGGGDFNRVDVPDLHADIEWLAGTHGGIDKLFAIPSQRTAVEPAGRAVTDRNFESDHDAKVGTVYFSARRAA